MAMLDDLLQREQDLLDDDQEHAIGDSPGWTAKLLQAFPAFRSRNYRLYFLGQLISLIGTWLQIVAEGWLILQLTHSAFWVGSVTALGTVPVLFLSLFGGVIVDHFPKKKILIVTQIASMVLALLYGFLTVFGVINVLEISLLALLLGTVNAIDMPARQAYLVEMVGKENLSSAIALNSGMFNGARVIGPGVAGLLIALIGTGGAFIVNGVSYIAAIAALLAMQVIENMPTKHPNPIAAIKQGIHYSLSHPIIKTLLIFSSLLSIFGWSYTTIMPVIIDRTFHGNAALLGYFYSASGIGAFLAAILISALTEKVKTATFIFGGLISFLIGVTLFTLTNNMFLALPLLFFSGFGLTMMFSTISTTIQHMVSDALRGRVLSIYTITFMGFSPIGSFQIGVLSETLGTSGAIQIGIAVLFLFGIYLASSRQKIQKAFTTYKTTT